MFKISSLSPLLSLCLSLFFIRINSLSREMREQRLLLEKMYDVMSKNDVNRSLNDAD